MTDVAINTAPAVTTFQSKNVQIPVLDRFRDLLVSLHDPHKRHSDLERSLLRNMEVTYGFNEQQRASSANLVADPSYMLKLQLALLAKNHNLLGGVDQFMKEFARICVDLGSRTVTQNLERALNAEIAISKVGEGPILKDFKELPREVDPLLLG